MRLPGNSGEHKPVDKVDSHQNHDSAGTLPASACQRKEGSKETKYPTGCTQDTGGHVPVVAPEAGNKVHGS